MFRVAYADFPAVVASYAIDDVGGEACKMVGDVESLAGNVRAPEFVAINYYVVLEAKYASARAPRHARRASRGAWCGG